MTGVVAGRGDPSLTCSRLSAAAVSPPPQRRSWHLDLHNHTRYSRDGTMTPQELLERAAARGVDALAVTDHDCLRGALECAALAAADPSLPRVIVGEEMASCQGDLVGLFLTRQIPGGLDVLDTISLVREQGGLVYLPHPFDSLRRATMAPDWVDRVAAAADVVEVANGRALTWEANRRALQLASRHATRLGAGSDAHYPGEVGRTYLELSSPLSLGVPSAFLRGLRRARPCATRPLVGLSRSWFFCLRTGLLMALRRRSGLHGADGG